MPELPEVEVLVRYLQPLLQNRTITSVQVRRARVIRPTSVRTFSQVLKGSRLESVARRGKYLLFRIHPKGTSGMRVLIGHLGMTGRMYLLPRNGRLPKHAAVVLGLGEEQFIFEDTRYFGRLTLDPDAAKSLGPEPLGEEFTVVGFSEGLARSSQAIKVKLLDQALVAGIGNIYASEALFRARISPRIQARRLSKLKVQSLWKAIRETLASAIEFGSTVPLDYAGVGNRTGLFYYGTVPQDSGRFEERLQVYDREGQACPRCGAKIRRIVQAARSTFYCPNCQRS